MAHKGSGVGDSEFELGVLRVRPRERAIESPAASVTVEPLVMQLLVALSRRAGQLVARREIFEICWGGSPVGDDSLNRIVAVLRKVLHRLAGDSVRIETVPAAGYVLRLGSRAAGETIAARNEVEVRRALDAAYDSWRTGLPEPDHLRLEIMRHACALPPDDARAWGMLALLCRHAAEYAEVSEISAYVAECGASARRALALEADQPEARTAIASVAPLFGRWSDARARLSVVLETHPQHAIAAHDLAILEMATGRVRAAKEIMDRLIAADPLAPGYAYKSIYQHWSVGDLTGMDNVGDRAIQLWPVHPAIWTARFWTLAYTRRANAALEMLADAPVRPNLPAPAVAFMRQVLTAVVGGAGDMIGDAVIASRKLAGIGPAQAIASLFALGLLKEADAAFEVAEAYYFREGVVPVPVRHTQTELSINDQHRRVTQILFTPVFDGVRDNARFMSICERTGLCRYWDASGLVPDFMR